MQPSLASLEGQFHAQDKVEGGNLGFQCTRDVQTLRHWEPSCTEAIAKFFFLEMFVSVV